MEEGGMKTCPVCGKLHVVTWPHLFPYRRGEKFYCCYDCMTIDESKDMNLIHQVRRERRMRKLARMKKDGTPAKRPGPKPKTAARPDVPKPIDGGDWEKIPKPAAELKLDGAVRIETPEAKNVQVVEVPERMKPVAPPIEYKVTGISTAVGNFNYFRKPGYIDWTDLNGETVSMTLEEWKELMRIWPFVLKVLGVEL